MSDADIQSHCAVRRKACKMRRCTGRLIEQFPQATSRARVCYSRGIPCGSVRNVHMHTRQAKSRSTVHAARCATGQRARALPSVSSRAVCGSSWTRGQAAKRF
jgi:hypothetical protein